MRALWTWLEVEEKPIGSIAGIVGICAVIFGAVWGIFTWYTYDSTVSNITMSGNYVLTPQEEYEELLFARDRLREKLETAHEAEKGALRIEVQKVNAKFSEVRKQLDQERRRIVELEAQQRRVDDTLDAFASSWSEEDASKFVSEGLENILSDQDYDIPETIKNFHPALVKLILQTDSMPNVERQYWFDILSSMSLSQKERLYSILESEQSKLVALERKFHTDAWNFTRENGGIRINDDMQYEYLPGDRGSN